MEIITRLNWVDVLAVIIMLRFTYVAFQDGLSHEIFPLIGSIVAIVLTFHYYDTIAAYLSANTGNAPIELLRFVTFSSLVIGISYIFKFFKLVIDKIIKVSWHPLIEKFGGLAAGLMRASIAVSIVLTILVLIPMPYLTRSIRDRSLTGMYFLGLGPTIYIKASRFLSALNIKGGPVDKGDLTKEIVSDKGKFEKATKKEDVRSHH